MNAVLRLATLLTNLNNVSVEELSADSCPRGNLMSLKQIFAREANMESPINFFHAPVQKSY